ncbi:hypothetical protein [Azospirillum doebereinerae]
MKGDLFAPLRPLSALHPQFAQVKSDPVFGPARGMFRELAAQMDDPDGNFIEQFQTHGFDSRTFEIFLFALFQEAGFTIDRKHDRPDFVLVKGEHTICVEAVTANPPPSKTIQPYTLIPEDRTFQEQQAFLNEEVPIRFGSPLYSKLKKRYWDLDHVRDRPFVLAIQSFHAPGSLGVSATPLVNYLLGLSHHWHYDRAGELVITTQPIDEHRIGTKAIPSGFFSLPDSEHVSGVLFSNTGTATKFNRVGHEGKYTSNAVRMIRYGTCYKHDPNAHLPDPFVYEVGNGEMVESWREGTVFIHNPRALHPIPPGVIGASAEEMLIDGRSETTFYEPFHPYASVTLNFPGHVATSFLQKRVDHLTAQLLKLFPIAT